MNTIMSALFRLKRQWRLRLCVILMAALSVTCLASYCSFYVLSIILPGLSTGSRLIQVWHSYPDLGIDHAYVSPPSFLIYKERFLSLEHFSAYAPPKRMNLAGTFEPSQVVTASVTANLPQTAGFALVKGRFFRPEEDQPDQRPALISESLWKSHFGSDPNLLGKQIRLNDISYHVEGIFVDKNDLLEESQVLIPLGLRPWQLSSDQHGNEFLTVLAFLKEGKQPAELQREAQAITNEMKHDFPRAYNNGTRWLIGTGRLSDQLDATNRTTARILLLSALCLCPVLILSTGIVLSSGSVSYRHECALRMALGASRLNLVKSLLMDMTVDLASTICVSFPLTYVAVAQMTPLADFYWLHSVGPIVMITGVCVIGIPTILSAWMPLTRAFSGNEFHDAIRGLSVNFTWSLRQRRLFTAMTILELAVATSVALIAIELHTTLVGLQNIDLGYSVANVSVQKVILPRTTYPLSRLKSFYNGVLDTLASEGLSTQVALASEAPLDQETRSTIFIGENTQNVGELHSSVRAVTSNYFQVLGIRQLTGKPFQSIDEQPSSPGVIIDQLTAHELWPTRGAIGGRLSFPFEDTNRGPTWRTVVGVVANVMEDGPTAGVTRVLYVPLATSPANSICFLSNSSQSPAHLNAATRRAVRLQDPGLPLPVSEPLLASKMNILQAQRRTTFFALLAAFVLLLVSFTGLTSTLVGMIKAREKEIAVRLCCGANRESIVKLFFLYSASTALVGCLLGISIASCFIQFQSHQLYNLHRPSASIVLTTLVLICILALLISLVTTLAVIRKEPMRLLRGT